jgi:hypothetical protein
MTATGLPSGQDEALNLMEQMLIASQVSAKTNAVIHRELSGAMADSPEPPMPSASIQPAPLPANQTQANQAQADPTQTLDTMTALILGSPEFQMH